MNTKTLQRHLAIFLAASLPLLASAEPRSGSSPAAKPKSSFNTQVYEKESTEKSFTSTVKLVREMQGTWEVMFDGQAGIYTVDEAHQNLLVESQKNKVPVMVKVNEEAMRILSASSAPRNPAGGQNPLGK